MVAKNLAHVPEAAAHLAKAVSAAPSKGKKGSSSPGEYMKYIGGKMIGKFYLTAVNNMMDASKMQTSEETVIANSNLKEANMILDMQNQKQAAQSVYLTDINTEQGSGDSDNDKAGKISQFQTEFNTVGNDWDTPIQTLQSSSQALTDTSSNISNDNKSEIDVLSTLVQLFAYLAQKM